jgi:hypothetical protein
VTTIILLSESLWYLALAATAVGVGWRLMALLEALTSRTHAQAGVLWDAEPEAIPTWHDDDKD